MIRAPAMSARWRMRAAVVLTAALAARGHAEIANRIVATIDGEPVTAHEVRRYAKDHNASPEVPESQVLQALITDKLLEKEIKALGINARDEDIDRYIGEVRSRSGLDEEGFKQALSAQGMTWEAYRAKVKAEIEKAQLVNREIRQRVNVSPQEIERYYDAHKADYEIAEQVKVRDILFAIDGSEEDDIARARAKAVEVRALATGGRDFAALARQFSDGPGADKGGELGTFGRGEMESALDEAVFSLKPGQVSEPIRTSAGFHLLRVDERIGAGHRPMAEVQDEIRDKLYNDALEERFQQWLTRDLRERHHVEVMD